MSFILHERLAADTLPLIDLPLCRVLLMNDSRFPWLVMVPMRPGLRDFHDVGAGDKQAFMAEIDRVSLALEAETGAFKLNVAALGNMVPQLHVHVIARFEGDAAWPGPVWGVGKPLFYAPEVSENLISRLRARLAS
jgi:diadenosine tetraphosphate (Ap4A) HIT family hydrolase